MSSARAVREIQENDLEFIPESVCNRYNSLHYRIDTVSMDVVLGLLTHSPDGRGGWMWQVSGHFFVCLSTVDDSDQDKDFARKLSA